jgi:hypothetical protein
MTRAPRSFAAARACSATPPPMPQISTVCPGRTAPRVATMRHAVSVTSGYAAASVHDTPSGSGSTLRPGTVMASAKVPARCSPRMPYVVHSDCSPARQNSQRVHQSPGFSSTRSPGFTRVTAGPTASTTPAPSAPRTCGNVCVMPGSPPTTNRSRWLSAAARTATTTSSGAWTVGRGTSATLTRSRPPYPEMVTARMDLPAGG